MPGARGAIFTFLAKNIFSLSFLLISLHFFLHVFFLRTETVAETEAETVTETVTETRCMQKVQKRGRAGIT